MRMNKKAIILFVLLVSLLLVVPVMTMAFEQYRGCTYSLQDAVVVRDTHHHIDPDWSMEERLEYMRNVLTGILDTCELDFIMSKSGILCPESFEVEPHGICVDCGRSYWQQGNTRVYN